MNVRLTVMNARERVGRNVRRLRVAAGVTQEVLAVDAKLETTHVSRIERGLGNPTLDVLERLADALSVEIEALVARSHDASRSALPNLKRGRKPK